MLTLKRINDENYSFLDSTLVAMFLNVDFVDDSITNAIFFFKEYMSTYILMDDLLILTM
jgi:hypothetical protein